MPTISEIKSSPIMLKTAKALTEIFRENTGTHFLDSGGAYGRNWERNQELQTWENFARRPAAYVDRLMDGSINGFTLDGWHYIVERFEYSRKWQKQYNKFVADSNEPHFVDMQEFIDHLLPDDKYGDNTIVFNTYNEETLLNETFQVVGINLEAIDYHNNDGWLYLIQYHGGCDVRGGYTSPIAVLGHPAYWYGIQDCEVSCSCSDTFNISYSASGDIYFYNHETQEDEYLESLEVCPKCGKSDDLQAHAPYFDSSSY